MSGYAVLWILGALAAFVGGGVLMTFYLKRRSGVQPDGRGLLLGSAAIVVAAAAFILLSRRGFDLHRLDVQWWFWGGLGVTWIGSSIALLAQRRGAGRVLLDLGPNQARILYAVFGCMMAVFGVVEIVNGPSRPQGIAYLCWCVWWAVMFGSRFQVRDKGILAGGGLIAWKRIAAGAEDESGQVVLRLDRGLSRTVSLKVPPDARAEFLRMVDDHTRRQPE